MDAHREKLAAIVPKPQVDRPEPLLDSDSIIVGQYNVRTPQETQEFLRDSEMGKILGVSHLCAQASPRPDLASTYQLIQSAFPQGIDDQSYAALLALLGEEMSDRTLAQVVADCTGKEYAVVLNDIYSVANQTVPSPVLSAVKQRLQRHGYDNWLLEE